ncbi:YqkE family protein [Paenibacillus segetis]|jgi:hypothetical protein|uniref:DUF3886 domain-containing protein n=1 Tax=Paenibacillus segetis TaxID=1325360 RepID=A0ABQ1YUL1_9BACL|nr:YqkE family protein [Paenibacillus segetis]GGH39151.1 hypothetical protein GCM10008013_47690 [Paenibacillus segetis]
MAKKKTRHVAPVASEDKPATLKDLLSADVLSKLKETAADMKREEEQRKEQARLKAEEERKAKQKQLDNNFEHLLSTSDMDWHKYK